jgi:HK97 gp10 family phage protein
MSSERVKVEGLEELGKALKEFPEILGKKYLARATFTAAAQIEARAISNAIASRQYQAAMQLIAKNIAIFKRRDEPNTAHYAIGVRRVRVSAKVKKVLRVLRRDEQAVKIENDTFFWWWFEKGTAERVVKKTGQHVGKIQAQPFLRPAFESEKENAVEVFRVTLADGVIAAAQEARSK